MKFKVDKKLLCEACGAPVKCAAAHPGKAFTCSNPRCRLSVTFDVTKADDLPDWVAPRGTYRNLRF